MAETTTALVPFTPRVEVLEPRAPRRVPARVIEVPVSAPRTRTAGRQQTTRRSGSRRGAAASFRRATGGLRRAAFATRRRVRNFSRRSKRAALGFLASRRGRATLTLGKVVLGVVLGVATAVALDAAINRYLTRNRGYRALLLSGATLLVWFAGSVMPPAWRPLFTVFASTHAVAGVIILGIDFARSTAAEGA